MIQTHNNLIKITKLKNLIHFPQVVHRLSYQQTHGTGREATIQRRGSPYSSHQPTEATNKSATTCI